MIYEVSKKREKKMKIRKIRKRSMKPQPNMQHNLLLLEATTKHGHLTKSSWSVWGTFGPSPGIRESCLGNNALRGR